MNAITKLFLTVLIMTAVGCREETPPVVEAPPEDAQAAPAAPKPMTGGLEKVSSNLVCMVNNQFMGVEQILVEVEGKKYYGCCENCKKTLAEEEKIRAAIDPFSGKTIDKASAVIGKLKIGNGVYYFESQENLDKFSKSLRGNS